MRSTPKILVAGAGIGGLTAAAALLRAGFEVEVFERAPALAEVGAGAARADVSRRLIAAPGCVPRCASATRRNASTAPSARRGTALALPPGMTRAVLLLTLLLAAATGCSGETPDPGGPDAAAGGPDAAAPACPNAIASDEGCGACLKAWGSGASYCAASCGGDDDCAGMTSGWGDVPLVCHPEGGYCTRSCTAASDCALGDGVQYTCDEGRCSVCPDCY